MSRFTIIDCEQRTPEWYAARAGCATSSRASDILAKIKTGEAASRRDYRLQLAVEQLTGLPQEEGYVSKDMQRGIDLEPAAVSNYEAESGLIVRRAGFIVLSDCRAGCSPDGYIGEFEGLVGFKCPKSATHVEYLRRRRVPPEYVPQVTHELWVTGAAWYDFCSFDDRLPDWLQYLCVRAYREEFDIAGYEKEVLKFLADVETETASLNKLRPPKQEAA